MSVPARLTLIATALALVVLAPATAFAQTQLPVGEAKGVRIVRPHGGVVLIFSPSAAKLRERIKSRYTWISCADLGDEFVGVHSGNLDAPRYGRRIETGFGAADADFCRLFLRAHTIRRPHESIHVGRRVLVSIPLTQRGAVYLDEEAKAKALFKVGVLLYVVQERAKSPGAPTYAQLVQAIPSLRHRVVELPEPAATPPPLRIGYFSDAAEHTVLATLSSSGRRLFVEQSAGEVLSTNVAKYLFGDPL